MGGAVVFRRWLPLVCVVLSVLIVGAACGQEGLSVRSVAPRGGVVVLETPVLTTIGAADDYLVAFDRFTAAEGNSAPGSIFDAAGKRVAAVSSAPFQAPLLGPRVQHDGGNMVLVAGRECSDAKMPSSGDATCSGLIPAVARLDLAANRWSDYAVLDDPNAPKSDDPMLTAVDMVGFSGLIRATSAGQDSLWLRGNGDTWVLVAREPTVASSGWCATADRIYRGPPVALEGADAFGGVESAPIPEPGREPTALQWAAPGPISTVPPDNVAVDSRNETTTVWLGCLADEPIAFSTQFVPPRSLRTMVGRFQPASSTLAWSPAALVGLEDRATRSSELIQGNGTVLIRVMVFDDPGLHEDLLVSFFKFGAGGKAAPIGPVLNLSKSVEGPYVVAVPKHDGSFVFVETRSR